MKWQTFTPTSKFLNKCQDDCQAGESAENSNTGNVMLSFSHGDGGVGVDGDIALVSADRDHPFFVSGQGWSSCSPSSSLDR